MFVHVLRLLTLPNPVSAQHCLPPGLSHWRSHTAESRFHSCHHVKSAERRSRREKKTREVGRRQTSCLSPLPQVAPTWEPEWHRPTLWLTKTPLLCVIAREWAFSLKSSDLNGAILGLWSQCQGIVMGNAPLLNRDELACVEQGRGTSSTQGPVNASFRGVPSLSTDQFKRGAGPGAKGCSYLGAFGPHCLVRTQPCAVLFFLAGLGASRVRPHRV